MQIGAVESPSRLVLSSMSVGVRRGRCCGAGGATVRRRDRWRVRVAPGCPPSSRPSPRPPCMIHEWNRRGRFNSASRLVRLPESGHLWPCSHVHSEVEKPLSSSAAFPSASSSCGDCPMWVLRIGAALADVDQAHGQFEQLLMAPSWSVIAARSGGRVHAIEDDKCRGLPASLTNRSPPAAFNLDDR